MVIFAGPSPGAEEVPEKIVRLNLRQLIERAIAASPEVGEAQSELAAVQSSVAQVEAAYYPRLESIAIVGPVEGSRTPIIQDNRIRGNSSDLGLGIFGRLDFTITQPLYTFGRLSNHKEAARHGAAATAPEPGKVKDELAFRVTRLFHALVFAREGLEAARDGERFFDDQQQRFERLLELGSIEVSETDLHMLAAFRAGVMHNRLQAEKGIRLAAHALKAMLELPAGTTLEVVAEPSGQKERENLPGEVQKALANRPEFEQLRQAVEARKYQVAAAESELYPSLFMAVIVSLAGAPGRESFDNPYIRDEFNHADAGAVAGLQWDFDFGIKQARIEEARANYRKVLYQQKTAEQGIPIQVAEAYEESIEWEKGASSYKEAASAARKWVVSSIADFDMGVGTAGNVLLAIEKYSENQGKYVEALFNHEMAMATLRYVTGTIRESGEESGEQP